MLFGWLCVVFVGYEIYKFMVALHAFDINSWNISMRRKKYSLNIEFYFPPFFANSQSAHTKISNLSCMWKKCSRFCGVFFYGTDGLIGMQFGAEYCTLVDRWDKSSNQ